MVRNCYVYNVIDGYGVLRKRLTLIVVTRSVLSNYYGVLRRHLTLIVVTRSILSNYYGLLRRRLTLIVVTRSILNNYTNPTLEYTFNLALGVSLAAAHIRVFNRPLCEAQYGSF